MTADETTSTDTDQLGAEPGKASAEAKGGPRLVPNAWWKVGAGLAASLLGAVLCTLFLLAFLRARPMDLVGHTELLAGVIEDVLITNHVPARAIRRRAVQSRADASASWLGFAFDVAVPPEVNVAGLTKVLRKELARRQVTLVETPEADGACMLVLVMAEREFARVRLTPSARHAGDAPAVAGEPGAAGAPEQTATPDEETPKTEGAPEEKTAVPRAAIILDDGGYGGPVTEAVLQLPPVLTLAILPNTAHATETATRAAALGFEVILHMPLENSADSQPFKGELATTMDEAAMAALTEDALRQIPNAVGVNYHRGTKFAADTDAMQRFLGVLKGKPLYFVDSRTSAASVAYDTAQAMGIRSAVRDVFLDPEVDEAMIRNQFQELIAVAQAQGNAVGIGHFKSDTVAILAEMLSSFEKAGVALVHASEMVQ